MKIEIRSDKVRVGLAAMLEAAIGPNEIVQIFVTIEWAMFIVALAKRAPERDDWFPSGKWATIQAIEGRINSELGQLTFKE